MDAAQLLWLDFCAQAAEDAGHPWPKYAACEAAEESYFGQSQLAKLGHNLFGVKAYAGSPYGELMMPTKEFINGEWIAKPAYFVSFPDFKTAFVNRMSILTRLQYKYPHYAAALAAPDGETFVREVSQTWSTDPHRADKVLAYYTEKWGA